MAEEESPSALRQAYRTVTPGYKSHPDAEMNSVGWVMFLVLVAVMLPLLPFLVAVWVVTKLIDYVARGGGGRTET
jgi:flagellar biogenesis protein FliO